MVRLQALRAKFRTSNSLNAKDIWRGLGALRSLGVWVGSRATVSSRKLECQYPSAPRSRKREKVDQHYSCLGDTYPCWGPYNNDYGILGSKLQFPYWKLLVRRTCVTVAVDLSILPT